MTNRKTVSDQTVHQPSQTNITKNLPTATSQDHTSATSLIKIGTAKKRNRPSRKDILLHKLANALFLRTSRPAVKKTSASLVDVSEKPTNTSNPNESFATSNSKPLPKAPSTPKKSSKSTRKQSSKDSLIFLTEIPSLAETDDRPSTVSWTLPSSRQTNSAASDDVAFGSYRPSLDEPFMNPRMQEYFRQKLRAWRDDVVLESKETLRNLQVEHIDQADEIDRAAASADRELELRARERQLRLLTKIDAALKRIDDGDYGYCMRTGDPIDLYRLEARPIATLSLDAQNAHEKFEKTHGEHAMETS